MLLKAILVLAILARVKGRTPFRCNSPNEVRNLAIKRVIAFNEDVYLFSGTQFIFFKAPFCFFDSEKQNLCGINQAFKVDTEFEIKDPGQFKPIGSLNFYTFNT